MIIPDKKKAVTVILSKLKPSGGESLTRVKPEEEMDPAQGALKAIAEDLLSAIDSRSASDLAQALGAFMAEIQAQDSIQDAEEAE